jgi:hypothetical protein
MMISSATLTVLVSIALAVTIAAPFILLALFIRDRNKGQLW